MGTCENCEYAGRPHYKSPCSECITHSKYEPKVGKMDVREKLVELLKKAICGEIIEDREKAFNAIADHLIAHGVTVQEWISVKDRLPTEDEDSNHIIVGVVNGYNGNIRFTDAEIFVRYCHTENAWWSDDYDIEGCSVEKFYVVPQPPKGE